MSRMMAMVVLAFYGAEPGVSLPSFTQPQPRSEESVSAERSPAPRRATCRRGRPCRSAPR